MGDFIKAGLRLAASVVLRKIMLPVIICGGIFAGILVLVLVMAGGAPTSIARADCDTIGSNAPGTSASAGTTTGGSAKDVANQKKIIHDIDDAVKGAGYAGKVTRITAIAAMGESTLENINYGDEGQGVTNPDGSPTTSRGILQQQNHWGSLQDRLDPKKATRLFLFGPHEKGGGLADVADWESLPESIAINKVQGNADPNYYSSGGKIEYVDKLLKEAGIDTGRSGKTHRDGTEKQQNGGSDSSSSQLIKDAGTCSNSSTAGKPGGNSNGKNTYPITDVPDPGIYTVDGAGFYKGECTSYAMWKLAEHYGAHGDPSSWPVGNTKGGKGTQLGDGQNWRKAWEARGWTGTTTPTANAVAWWGPQGAVGIGPSGHVGWVDSVEKDGNHFVISEYNNAGLAPPGHKYSQRSAITMQDSQAPNAFLIPPDKNQL